MKTAIAIWIVAIMAALGLAYTVNAEIDSRVERAKASMYQTYSPQTTERGYSLQPTVGDPYMQWGESPQKTETRRRIQGN